MERLTHGEVRRLAAEGRTAEALVAAAAMLEANPADLTAWHLLARALGAAGRSAEAAEAFGGLARACERAGDLPLAIVAALEHGLAGGEPGPLLERLAARFSAAAEGLVDGLVASPPPVPRPVDVDLGLARRPGEVDRRVERALAVAESALEGREPAPRRYFPLLSALGPEAFARLAAGLAPVELPPGRTVVAQGEPGGAFYIVARGEVRVVRERSDGETLLARLGAGGFFGEMAIVARSPRAARVETAGDATLLEADLERLGPVLGETPELGEVLAAFCRARMLENVVLASPVLARVPVAERGALFGRFLQRVHRPGAVVIEEGTESAGLHLIVSGEVAVTRREEGETLTIARLGPGDLFGEISLVLRRPATATVRAEAETVTLALPRASFLDVIRDHPGLLSELYETALRRDQETASILAREAIDADDLVLL